MEIQAPLLGSGCSDSYLDLQSHVLFINDAPADESVEANAFWTSRYHHELGHWRRFHGSTIGHLLTLLKYARDRSALTGFVELSTAQRETVIKRRGSGHPIWSFKRGYEPGLAGESFGLQGQFWLDLYYTYMALFDYDSLKNIPGTPEEAFRLSIADAWLFVDKSANYARYPGNDRARSWLHGSCLPAVTSHGHLTTRLLLECGSTIDEILMLGKNREDHHVDVQEYGRRKLHETEYGMPARIAEDFIGPYYTLQTLQAIIDFALNPPLPFMYRSILPLGWDDFYPPLRFIKILEAVSEDYGSVFVAYGNNEEHLRFRSFVLAHSDLLYGKNEFEQPERPGIVNFTRPAASVFYNSLLDASRALLYCRSYFPSDVASPKVGRVRTFPRQPNGLENALRAEIAFYPFVSQMPEGLGISPGMSNEDAVAYLNGMMVSVTLDTLVNEVGSVPSDVLPTAVPVDHFRHRAAEQVADLTGVSLQF
jgi:hypothetical protein